MRKKAERAESIGDGDDDDTLCARRSPQYKGIEAEPLMKPPPYIHTITGRC